MSKIPHKANDEDKLTEKLADGLAEALAYIPPTTAIMSDEAVETALGTWFREDQPDSRGNTRPWWRGVSKNNQEEMRADMRRTLAAVHDLLFK